jgi:hypothetical protein
MKFLPNSLLGGPTSPRASSSKSRTIQDRGVLRPSDRVLAQRAYRFVGSAANARAELLLTEIPRRGLGVIPIPWLD